jgi:hypothetical protein
MTEIIYLRLLLATFAGWVDARRFNYDCVGA